MSSSTIDLIREARANALDEFKMRFKQKWYGNLPCFHWRTLGLSDEMITSMEQVNPSLYLMTFTDEILDLEDKVWEIHELQSTLNLEDLKIGNASFNLQQIEAWLKYNVEKINEERNIDQAHMILCYKEGTNSLAKEWRAHFESQLKI